MAKYYLLGFQDFDTAKKAHGFLRDIDEFKDNRDQKSKRIYCTFEKPLDQKKAGRFRSHFYDGIMEKLKLMNTMQGKTIQIKVVRQMMIVDVDGEPVEMVFLPQDATKTTCKVVPNTEGFEFLGIGKGEAEDIIAKATRAAEAEQ